MRQLFTMLFKNTIFPERSRRVTLLLVVIVGLSMGHSAYAQNAHFLTWQANTYTPPGFLGRPLPTKGSSLVLSFQTLVPTESFSNIPFTWYFNNRKIAEGIGKTKVATIINERPGIYEAKVFLRHPDNTPETIITSVKVVAPEVLLTEEVGIIQRGVLYAYPRDLHFRALPFFFNATSLFDLSFIWSVGDTTSQDQNPEKPNEAIIAMPGELPPRTQTVFGVRAINLGNEKENTSQSVTVTSL